MNMAQQQIEQMLASGELETMVMEFLSSGQFEQMVQDFMADPATQQMIEEMMASLLAPPTEEEAAMIMSLLEEVMKMPTEGEMAEMEEAWTEMMSNMMGMTGEDMQKMMQMMEMKAHCQCTTSNVAYGQMAMPDMTAAGRK